MLKLIKHSNYNIYILIFDDQYDMCMHFLRLQDFSEDALVQEQYITTAKRMHIYRKYYKEKIFTYPTDWCGFNLTSKDIRKFDWSKIEDFNHYDEFMKAIISKIEFDIVDNSPYSLISALNNDFGTLNHEICHALYFLDTNFKEQQEILLKKLDNLLYSDMVQTLKNMGYAETNTTDEIQAYLSTGLCKQIKSIFRKHKLLYKNISQPFRDNYKPHRRYIAKIFK